MTLLWTIHSDSNEDQFNCINGVEKSCRSAWLVRSQLDHVDLDADQLDSDVDHF